MKENHTDHIGYHNHQQQKNRRAARHRRKKRIVLFRLAAVGMFVFILWNGIDNLRNADDPQRSSIPFEGVQALNSSESSELQGAEGWSLILVNRDNPIPDGYDVDLTTLDNGEKIDTRIYLALRQMFDAARGNNIYPVVASGYRTEGEQQQIMDDKIEAYKQEGYSQAQAKQEAETWVAVPGTSEHQLGIAVDINGDGIQTEGKEVYDWLDQNSYRFGFIRRYPPDKTGITGVSNEPWHYRYVGLDAAADIYRGGICLEEYLAGTAL